MKQFRGPRHLELGSLSLSALHALCLFSTPPLFSDRPVYPDYVGWGVLFSRASCFAAVLECLFLFHMSRDLFGLGIWVWVRLREKVKSVCAYMCLYTLCVYIYIYNSTNT